MMSKIKTKMKMYNIKMRRKTSNTMIKYKTSMSTTELNKTKPRSYSQNLQQTVEIPIQLKLTRRKLMRKNNITTMNMKQTT